MADEDEPETVKEESEKVEEKPGLFAKLRSGIGRFSKASTLPKQKGIFAKLWTITWVTILFIVFYGVGSTTGLPLLIISKMAYGLWYIIDFTLLPLSAIFGIQIMPLQLKLLEFGFNSMIIGPGLGGLLNAFFVVSLYFTFRSAAIAAKVTGVALHFWKIVWTYTWLFLIIQNLLVMGFTGYVPIYSELNDGALATPSLCILSNNIAYSVNSITGLGEDRLIECTFEGFITAQSDAAAALGDSSFFAKALSPLENQFGLGSTVSSDEVEDEYLTNENAGVTIDDIEPLLTLFSSMDNEAQNIQINAKLNVRKLFITNPGETENVKVRIYPEISSSYCTCELLSTEGFERTLSGTCSSLDEVAATPFTSTNILSYFGIGTSTDLVKTWTTENINGWCSDEWVCVVTGTNSANHIFNVPDGYNQQIQCYHSGLSLDETKLPRISGTQEKYKLFKTTFNYAFFTEAVAWRQLFVVDKIVSNTQTDIPEYLKINQESIGGYSVTDNKIQYAIGTDQGNFVLPSYSTDALPNEITLMVKIKNPDSSQGDISFNPSYGDETNHINLSISSNNLDSIHVLCSGSKPVKNNENEWTVSESCLIGDSSIHFVYDERDDTENKLKFHVKEEFLDRSIINPGETKTYYLRLLIDSDVVSTTLFDRIYLKTETTYWYEQSESKNIRVKPETAYSS